MFYRYTQDPELKAILRATVADLLETERSNGSISCVPVGEQPGDKKGDLWERKYVMLALEEYYEQVEADSAVLGSLKRQADCILLQIGPAPKREITDLGWSDNHIESSTLLEPIMRLYKWTGEARYLDFARYIVESGGCQGYNLFQQTLDGVPPYQMGGTYPKAYEMLSLFEGVVEYYRCTGEERWLQVALQLYQAVCRYELTIIGSGGGDQPHHPKVLGEAWDHTAVEQTNPELQPAAPPHGRCLGGRPHRDLPLQRPAGSHEAHERTDAAYNRPVQVVADSCGLVALSPVTPLLPGSRLEFEVPTTDGSIRLTDYASVDCWEGSHICTWLPKNSYELRVTSYSRISYKLRATSYK